MDSDTRMHTSDKVLLFILTAIIFMSVAATVYQTIFLGDFSIIESEAEVLTEAHLTE